MTEVIRRMIDSACPPQAEGAPGADRGWRLALARAARDGLALDLDVSRLTVTRQGLAELLDLAPDRALVAVLDGPRGAMGVVLFAPEVTAAVIEMQTLGRLSALAPTPRKPTRIDAAMVAGLIDRALAGLEDTLAEEEDLSWAGGFRYGSFLEEIRPLALLLEEEAYRVLAADLVLGGGLRQGRVILALPAQGRGDRPMVAPAGAETEAPQFTAALSAQVLHSECRLEAVVGRLTLPIRQIMALTEGDVLTLPQAAIDAIALETADGRQIALGKLGQHRGQRALKLTETAATQQVVTTAERRAPVAPTMTEPLRATG